MAHERDHVALRPEQVTIPPGHPWNRLPVIAAVVALLGAVACAILGPGNPKQFFFSWLVSFLFFLSLALGALFFVLIQYAAQGGWGIVLRRIGETIFATLPGDGGPVPPGAARPARSLLVDRPRRRRARCAASLEGAIPQRAVLPDPGGALLRPLVLHRRPLLPRLARPGRDGGSRGVGPPAPPRRARHHRPRADPELRLDRLDHVAHAALVLDHLRRLFLRGLLRGVHRAPLGRRGGDAPGGAAGHGHQRRAPARCRKVPLRVHGVLGLYRLLPVLPHVVREPPGGDDLVQGADGGVLAARSRSSSWRDISWRRSST